MSATAVTTSACMRPPTARSTADDGPGCCPRLLPPAAVLPATIVVVPRGGRPRCGCSGGGRPLWQTFPVAVHPHGGRNRPQRRTSRDAPISASTSPWRLRPRPLGSRPCAALASLSPSHLRFFVLSFLPSRPHVLAMPPPSFPHLRTHVPNGVSALSLRPHRHMWTKAAV